MQDDVAKVHSPELIDSLSLQNSVYTVFIRRFGVLISYCCLDAYLLQLELRFLSLSRPCGWDSAGVKAYCIVRGKEDL